MASLMYGGWYVGPYAFYRSEYATTPQEANVFCLM